MRGIMSGFHDAKPLRILEDELDLVPDWYPGEWEEYAVRVSLRFGGGERRVSVCNDEARKRVAKKLSAIVIRGHIEPEGLDCRPLRERDGRVSRRWRRWLRDAIA